MCFFEGKEIPDFVTFSEGGGINASILTDIFERMDSLQLYNVDKAAGLIPFVLLDGHTSRFELKFLDYITHHEDHQWNVCIGVPYGTAVWQVADSSQQNGKFKMLLNENKKKLFNERLQIFQQKLHLMRTDILPLVNSSWPQAFADVENNKKAISERGWFPFNRNLLRSDIICANMTEEMLAWERACGSFTQSMLEMLHNAEMVEKDSNVHLCPKHSPYLSRTNLNFDSGITAQYVSNSITTNIITIDA